jgi:hypothetical protein
MFHDNNCGRRFALTKRVLSLLLVLLFAGCSEAPAPDGRESAESDARTSAGAAKGTSTGSAEEPESSAQNVPFPPTTRNPFAYAYDSDMSKDGWEFGLRAEAAGNVPRARRDDDDLPEPDPPDPNVYTVTLANVGSRAITVQPHCSGTTVLYRRIENGALTQVGSVSCGAAYVDRNVQPGLQHCYAIRPSASKPMSPQACARSRYEPYKFDALANSRAVSEQVVKAHDWRKTEAIYAGQPSAPTLWYVNILADYADDLRALRALGVHTQTLPLFPEEQAVWHPDNDVVEVNGKLAGRWLYALIPGAIYNDLRVQMQEALAAGRAPGFRAIVFRAIPVSDARVWPAMTTSPSPIDLEYVGKMGVEFNGFSSCQGTNPRICRTQQQLLGWLVRKAYNFVADFVDTVVEGVRQIIGKVARLIKGDATLTLRFKLLNREPTFGSANEVTSAWRNGPLLLRNTRVQLSQGLALFKGDTDSSGVARIKVAKGWSGKICLELENNRVSFTGGWAESTACVGNFSATNSDRTIDVPVSHNLVNAFATMTDAADYVETVMGYGMPRVKVLVGWAADKAGGGDQSFAPCLGMAPVLLSGLLDLGLGALLPPLDLAAALAEAFYSVDIMLKSEDQGLRSVATHEYGHTVMCAMMRSASQISAETALLDILAAYKTGDRKDPTKQQTYMTEALADFLTLQVTGGTNYVTPKDSRCTETGGVAYCHAGSRCYDENLQPAPSDWSGQLRRTISILQDAFDNTSAGTSAPNDGSHWKLASSTLVPDVRLDSNLGDEPFELAGSDMRQIYERWANRGGTLRESSFFGGLGELLLERGYSQRAVCDMFATHTATGLCPDYIQKLEKFETLSVGLTKPAGTTLTVTSDKGGIHCTAGTCTTKLQHGETVVLTASRAVTWSGCTRLSSTRCQVQMTGTRSVQAKVDPPLPDDGLPPVCQSKPDLPQCSIP